MTNLNSLLAVIKLARPHLHSLIARVPAQKNWHLQARGHRRHYSGSRGYDSRRGRQASNVQRLWSVRRYACYSYPV